MKYAMIGRIRGALPASSEPLGRLRLMVESKDTMSGYTRPDRPLLQDALSALRRAVPCQEFLPAVDRILAIRGHSPLGIEVGSVSSWKRPTLRNLLRELILASGASPLPSRLEGERRHGQGIISKGRAPELAKALLAKAKELAGADGVRELIPEYAELPSVGPDRLERMVKGPRTDTANLVVGLVIMAATARQPPATSGAVLLAGYSQDGKQPQSGGIGWVDDFSARRLYETKSEEALIEAARSAAIRDTHVDLPSHECLPGVYSLLLPSSRQFIVDDETDLLAMDFLLIPLGLLPGPKLPQLDWLRPLTETEVRSLESRLDDLNRLSFDEFLQQAGDFYRQHHGAPEGAKWATELRGMLRDDLKKLLAAAAKKKEAVTLVACNDWLGNKKQ
jgi:hypothetical protein